jgi:hypothetical protein
VICRNRHRGYKETDHKRYGHTYTGDITKHADIGDSHTDTGDIKKQTQKIWTHRHRRKKKQTQTSKDEQQQESLKLGPRRSLRTDKLNLRQKTAKFISRSGFIHLYKKLFRCN